MSLDRLSEQWGHITEGITIEFLGFDLRQHFKSPLK